MKLTAKILCCCLVLHTTVTCLGQTETRGLASSNSFALAINKSQAPDHGGKIQSRYDGFSHETM